MSGPQQAWHRPMSITEALPHLSPAVARYTLHTLIRELPPAIPDTQEDRAERDEAAIAAVAALHPEDAFEARLAVRIVAADAQAADCLRSAAASGHDASEARRCRAQAGMMMRHADSALRSLERRQAARDKALAEMHPAAMERAGYWFRDVSVPLPEPAPAQAEAAAPAPARARPEFSELTEAEQYALIHPRRAVRIRAAGGLPTPCDFGPPEPAIVAQLVHGTSPILLALDHHERDAAEA
jgi:hypothetical protein